MDPCAKRCFPLIVFAQALHSVEEYPGRLWEVFPPATFLCRLVLPSNLHVGFLIINIGLFVLGVAVWLLFVRTESRSAPAWIWFWIIIELINGVGHPLWSLMQGGYTPGVATAPLLLSLAAYLLVRMWPPGLWKATS